MFSFFERLIQPFPPEEPTQPPATLVAFCRHYTKGVGLYLVIMAISTAAVAILEASLFDFLGKLVDWLGTKNPETFWQEEQRTIYQMAFVMLVALPISVLIHTVVVHQSLLGNYPMIIRWQAHRYLLGQSLSFYQNEFAGRIATKVMQTSLAVREAVMKLMDVMLYICVYFVSMVIIVAQGDVRLSLPLVGWVIGYVSVLSFFIPRLKKISARQADARSDMTGRIVDSYTNISTIKLFSHSRRESDYAKEGMDKFLQTVYPQMRLASWLNIAVWMLNIALIFSIFSLSIYLWMQHAITAGSIAIAMGLSLRLNGMSHWIMWELSALFENIGTTQDGMETLSLPREVVDVSEASDLHVEKGCIEFDRVRFHYGKPSGVFEDMTLVIHAGEKIGLVGRSGAGKSTLVNLLLRFYDVEGGVIRIDGQDISHVRQESLRENIGMVTQDTSLLHRSVRENIVFGTPDASEEQMIAAAKQAEAHEFILGLQDVKGRTAYDAHVGERGVKLSGGQRQRIAIARVLLKDAPILVLDEATSALDSEVEAAIQDSLNTLMAGKTVIAIAHRLSTIAALDRLIVLDEGCIVEQGTHEQLVAAGGLYAQLWSRQSGGFLGIE